MGFIFLCLKIFKLTILKFASNAEIFSVVKYCLVGYFNQLKDSSTWKQHKYWMNLMLNSKKNY